MFPLYVTAKIRRAPLSERASMERQNRSSEAVSKPTTADRFEQSATLLEPLRSGQETLSQNGFFSAVSYSLFSPTFEVPSLKSMNQESLGWSIVLGYSYIPPQGWGAHVSVGVLQNSKTDRSLPDFIVFKPATALVYAVTKSIYVTGGIFNYYQQGTNVKSFRSHLGHEYFVGFKANKKVNIKFGFSSAKFSGEFVTESERITSKVSIRSLESQVVYLF